MRGTAEQGRTSKLAWENQMTLHMIMAEKMELCVLIGDEYTAFITFNTASDVTITKALQGLPALTNELANNSGINDPLTN
jgi:hypothetical protein